MNFADDPRVKVLADKYGLDHQLGKAIEECEELEGAIIQHRLETTTDSKWAVVCEYKYQRQLARVSDEEKGRELAGIRL